MGSDVHATAAANLFSLIASCQLHGLEPETYLRDIIRVLPYWPRERYLELAPKYWSRTVGRLDPKELDAELGHITVPAPLPAEQHPPSGRAVARHRSALGRRPAREHRPHLGTKHPRVQLLERGERRGDLTSASALDCAAAVARTSS
jgi:hypothetical protein